MEASPELALTLTGGQRPITPQWMPERHWLL